MGYSERKWGIKKSVKTRLFVHVCGGDACDMGFTRHHSSPPMPQPLLSKESPCITEARQSERLALIRRAHGYRSTTRWYLRGLFS